MAAPDKRNRDHAGILLNLGIWAVTFAVLWPATSWLVAKAVTYDQLLPGLFILLGAGILLIREEKGSFQLVLHFGKRSLRDLALAYVALAVAVLVREPYLVLAAYCLAVSAGLLYVFGDDLVGIVYPLIIAFLVFLIFVLLLPAMDWPLRAGAARTSAWLLNLLGHDVKLALDLGSDPKLLLIVNRRPFEVAAECNGFGLISGSALLAVLMTFLRRVAWFDKVLSVLVAVIAAYLLNSIRIILISLLAPWAGDHYWIMHEVIGVMMFIGGLGAVYWLIAGLPATKQPLTRKRSRPSAA